MFRLEMWIFGPLRPGHVTPQIAGQPPPPPPPHPPTFQGGIRETLQIYRHDRSPYQSQAKFLPQSVHLVPISRGEEGRKGFLLRLILKFLGSVMVCVLFLLFPGNAGYSAVWQVVAMDSLKFHQGLPCPTLVRPCGRARYPLNYLTANSGVARPQGGSLTAVFYPLGHSTPYAYALLVIEISYLSFEADVKHSTISFD
jgi:hypothetical protein